MAKQQLKKTAAAMKFLKPKFNANTYEYSDKFEPVENPTKDTAHTPYELIKALESDKDSVLDAIVLCFNPDTKTYGYKRLNKTEFIEAFKKGSEKTETPQFKKALREARKEWEDRKNTKLKEDDGGISGITQGFTGGPVGADFIPLLGGNFYKNLYYYDYIRMSNLCFWAAHHDPIGRAYINMMRDFTLGRGFSVDSTNEKAMAIWKAFEKVNDVQGMMESVARELPSAGETMLWWLPNNETKIMQNPYPGQVVNEALIPRVRLIDTSVIWEIVTWPEDITKVLYYVWVAPTAYQVYTGMQGDSTPSSKFIFQTIPADQIMHFKVNAFVGEKRGRSDMFPALGFMKRLRDSVDYALVAQIKQSAYSEDVEINGDQADVDAYTAAQEAEGAQPASGSSFVHTAAVKRSYISPATGGKGNSTSFEWALSMASIALGIPMSYWGSHLSGGQTRSSAIVATEPVAKKFEMRQRVYENMIRAMWDRVMDWAQLGRVEVNITFPEIIVQDRSQKLKDLALCEAQNWLSEERCATIAAKEMGIEDFDYDQESITIKSQAVHPPAIQTNPLTGDSTVKQPGPGDSEPKPSAVTSDEKANIKQDARS